MRAEYTISQRVQNRCAATSASSPGCISTYLVWKHYTLVYDTLQRERAHMHVYARMNVPMWLSPTTTHDLHRRANWSLPKPSRSFRILGSSTSAAGRLSKCCLPTKAKIDPEQIFSETVPPEIYHRRRIYPEFKLEIQKSLLDRVHCLCGRSVKEKLPRRKCWSIFQDLTAETAPGVEDPVQDRSVAREPRIDIFSAPPLHPRSDSLEWVTRTALRINHREVQ